MTYNYIYIMASRQLCYYDCGPYFESHLRRSGTWGGQGRDFWSFSRGSSVSPLSFHQHSPLSTPPTHFHVIHALFLVSYPI